MDGSAVVPEQDGIVAAVTNASPTIFTARPQDRTARFRPSHIATATPGRADLEAVSLSEFCAVAGVARRADEMSLEEVTAARTRAALQ